MIAHETLPFLLHEFFQGYRRSQVEFFHYLDDIILLSVNRALRRAFTKALC